MQLHKAQLSELARNKQDIMEKKKEEKSVAKQAAVLVAPPVAQPALLMPQPAAMTQAMPIVPPQQTQPVYYASPPLTMYPPVQQHLPQYQGWGQRRGRGPFNALLTRMKEACDEMVSNNTPPDPKWFNWFDWLFSTDWVAELDQWQPPNAQMPPFLMDTARTAMRIHGIGGSVVGFSPIMRKARVRFPANASTPATGYSAGPKPGKMGGLRQEGHPA
ncbi:hypothetical protein QTP70_003407 [Hemibagrus guttatus]|uniref:Uncharacterized protein n=1 Tax=Hemibagrus guttatus TaxID=175788 RepID=A0AAE0QCG1_9TELE|nr:hypothetical protein QTP70_003407 [Hemibagrus guttatus]